MQSHRQRFALQLRFPSISKSVLAKLQFLLKQLLVCYIIKRFILKIIYCYINFHSLDVRTISQFRPRIWHRDSQNQVKEIQFTHTCVDWVFLLLDGNTLVAESTSCLWQGPECTSKKVSKLRIKNGFGRTYIVHLNGSQSFKVK